MDYRTENVKNDTDIVKTQGKHHFRYIFSKPLDVITINVYQAVGKQ